MSMTERYLEDYAVGQTFGSGRIRVDEERIKAFAAEFDPQPFHLDEASASSTIFRGLAASGWHTAAVTMRLLVDGELKPAGGIVGLGFDEFQWHARCDREMNCMSRAKYWRCGRQSPVRIRASSRCAQRRSTRMASPFRFKSATCSYPYGGCIMSNDLMVVFCA